MIYCVHSVYFILFILLEGLMKMWQVNVRMGKSLFDILLREAKKQDRSLAYIVREILSKAADRIESQGWEQLIKSLKEDNV